MQARERRFRAHRTGRLPQGVCTQMTSDTFEIEASGNGQVMQMRFGQPLIGRTAPARGAQRLRERAFDAGTPGVLLHEGRRGLLARRCCKAACSSWGARVRVRPACAWVQQARTGQARQVAVAKRITTRGCPRPSRGTVQPTLCSLRQVATCSCQLMVKSSKA